jgi:hypothetical protein
MPRRRLLLVGALALLGLATVVPWLMLRRSGGNITQEDYDRIHAGMTGPEVHNILGQPVPHAKLRDLLPPEDFAASDWGLIDEHGRLEVWLASEAIFTVEFVGGRVINKTLYPRPSARHGLFSWVRRLLRG